MDLAWIAVAAFGAAVLTFFSGFGLGTILTPVYAIFLPLEVAVAATALVHLANSALKVSLLGRHAARQVVLRFGIPAIIAAIFGAWLLARLAHASAGPPLAAYTLVGHTVHIRWLGLVIGGLMITFAIFELSPRFARQEFPRSALPLGGALSGFFGGLSGHQGALRSAFLVRCGLDKRALVATSAVLSLCVDATRLLTYALAGSAAPWSRLWSHESRSDSMATFLAVGVIAATAGTLLGTKLLHKATLRGIRWTVGAMLLVLGTLIAAGIV